MSFLRHTQIYRPMVWIFQAGRLSTVPPSSSDESAPGYSWRVALLHCSLPLHQATAIVKPLAGNRQPPLAAGWGIFNWRNGEFSLGVDICTPRREAIVRSQAAKGTLGLRV